MDSELCSHCKIFFGNQEGLCSKCFKETKQNRETSALPPLDIATNVIEEKKTETILSDRCKACGKKLGPINFRCKCAYFFCSHHRLPEEHKCTYDHKALGIRKLSEENPLIQAEKFNKL